MEDSNTRPPTLAPVGRMMTDLAVSGAKTGIVVMPELDFAALVPNMPGMLMESPSRGRGKNTVRFNLLPEIQSMSWHDRSTDVGVAREVSEPFDPPGHLFLQREIAPRSVFSTAELMLRARKLLRRARSTFHSTRPSQNAASRMAWKHRPEKHRAPLPQHSREAHASLVQQYLYLDCPRRGFQLDMDILNAPGICAAQTPMYRGG
ncbi:unnamed protein product [Polarella glacialis]|uniref:Uncharacterized protein n=1 Tax=Polarella glacialis TaxID=89957 RepID=A0A813KR10_POLGL|nr:unnamed protein product [Polarella glacialis]